MNFWDFFWLLVWSFFFVMYLMVLFQIIRDLFRDSDLSGWLKALWIIALVIAPFLSAFIYLMARGRGMAERQARDMAGARAAREEYIQSVSGRSGSADQIASAKQLLDSDQIDADPGEAVRASGGMETFQA